MYTINSNCTVLKYCILKVIYALKREIFAKNLLICCWKHAKLDLSLYEVNQLIAQGHKHTTLQVCILSSIIIIFI